MLSLWHTLCILQDHACWKKKLSYFNLRNWVVGEPKIGSGIHWRIFESNNHEIFDSQYRVNLTLNIESIWLSISRQFDSQYRGNLTVNIDSIGLKYSPITRNPGSNFSFVSGSTFKVKMTPLFLSVQQTHRLGICWSR